MGRFRIITQDSLGPTLKIPGFGVPWWLSRLRIWHCRCGGLGHCYGPGTSTCYRHSPPPPKKIPGFNHNPVLSSMFSWPDLSRLLSLLCPARASCWTILLTLDFVPFISLHTLSLPFSFSFFVFLPFLGPLPRHMEGPRLGV